jgi:hypothetical protein
MTRSAPATTEAPPPDPAESGRLLNALLTSAGLSIREDVVSAPAAAEPKRRPRRRQAPSDPR